MIQYIHKTKLIGAVGLCLLLLTCHTATAQDKDICRTVRFAHPGWADLDVSIGWSGTLLRALGYKTSQVNVSSTISFASLKNKDLDIALATWLPAGEKLLQQYKGNYDKLGLNLPKMRYTLATTKHAYDAGLRSWQDIPKFEKELKGKIYGIEPGSAGNEHITDFTKDMGIDKKFKVIEASTNAMLAQVEKNRNGFIVYLAWDGHWMSKYNPQYLSGGEKWLGKDSIVITIARKDYKVDCPNVAQFFKNFQMDLDALNESVNKVANKQPVDKVTTDWLKTHPAVVAKWLQGVTTFDGRPGLPVVREALSM